ncbi:N-acetyltransferase [Rhizobium sp. 32-5/1]|uniref:GNAT family N-acetyltransferase n=1 Tax=Rhizobium sp. 32-5/1 TaxID=3019602 RepID=UPI00240E68A7|nr:N-acetyltransferase [Rhizobium sp. 32-5/1]WEZ83494.1 N-acetyltransferase [Rhizobium sp. 32-5/1]
MIIRPEMPADVTAIRNVTLAAFKDPPHSNQTEHLIIERLRAAGALVLSLVAEAEGSVIGHIAFSAVTVSSGATGWFGLGPVSVQPEFQRRGVGAGLIQEGLESLSKRNAAGCVVMGDPDLYRKFGFASNPALVLQDCAPQYFLALALHGPPASGIVSYHDAFYGEAR